MTEPRPRAKPFVISKRWSGRPTRGSRPIKVRPVRVRRASVRAAGRHVSPGESEVVQQYIATARDLARSAVLNAVEGMHVDIQDGTDREYIALRLAKRDREMGFPRAASRPLRLDEGAGVIRSRREPPVEAHRGSGVEDADPDATAAAPRSKT